MPHFASGGRGGFAVEVELGAALGEEVLPLLDFSADYVGHLYRVDEGTIAERPVHNRADGLFELAGERRFNGPVPRVVGAGSHFIG